jgi:hypothetical protein
MRCREARRRLTESRKGQPADIEDRELLDHLAECPDCAQEAKALGTLRQMLLAAGENDAVHVTPMSAQKDVVEARAAQTGRGILWRRLFWFAMEHGGRNRLRYGIGVAVAVALLTLVSLVPFRYDHTIGYDVAFAGVCREVGIDDERICDVLYELGLEEADIGISECDSTCDLTVVDLKSEQEVGLVVAAFNGLCTDDPVADVIPVVTSTSGSLLRQANERIFTGRPADTDSDAIQ